MVAECIVKRTHQGLSIRGADGFGVELHAIVRIRDVFGGHHDPANAVPIALPLLEAVVPGGPRPGQGHHGAVVERRRVDAERVVPDDIVLPPARNAAEQRVPVVVDRTGPPVHRLGGPNDGRSSM